MDTLKNNIKFFHPKDPKYNIEFFKKKFNIVLSDDLEEFIAYYGYAISERELIFNSIDSIPINGENKNRCSFSIFYGWGEDQNSIVVNRVSYLDVIPKEFLVIGEASPGDQICICLEGDDQGKIYYWMHDTNKNEKELYLIANTLKDFVNSFEVVEEKRIDLDIEEEWFSDDF